jgi:hypothetical protein
MAIDHLVQLRLELEPVGTPWVRVMLNQQENFLQLTQRKTFDFELSTHGTKTLSIQHCNKSSSDKNTAVIIKNLSFFGIQDTRFIWQGQYRPEYPEPWASQQKNCGITLAPVLTPVDCLGWNGIWTLEFDVPIFTWIHRVQNLGWIYD